MQQQKLTKKKKYRKIAMTAMSCKTSQRKNKNIGEH